MQNTSIEENLEVKPYQCQNKTHLTDVALVNFLHRTQQWDV